MNENESVVSGLGKTENYGCWSTHERIMLRIFNIMDGTCSCFCNNSCMEIFYKVEERLSLVAKHADYSGFLCQKWLSLIENKTVQYAG
ncbi:MAG: hypothetical protein PHO32_05090 [Candidatus Cloacimonetes bacterium]|nr:hypothetical protein [Candidatus Cloacimonadota bacterium]